MSSEKNKELKKTQPFETFQRTGRLRKRAGKEGKQVPEPERRGGRKSRAAGNYSAGKAIRFLGQRNEKGKRAQKTANSWVIYRGKSTSRASVRTRKSPEEEGKVVARRKETPPIIRRESKEIQGRIRRRKFTQFRTLGKLRVK